MQQWVEAKIDRLTEKTQRIVQIAQAKISRGQGGIFFFTLVRMTPLVTFGWANGIAGGLTEMQWMYLSQ